MYEVVKAKSIEEAQELSTLKVGALVEISKVSASANGDGTYSVRVVEVKSPS